MEDNDRFVDELLDSALAHHRDAEPRPGLEGRILANVRAASQESSRKKAWKLWLAAAATAAVLALVAIHVGDRSPQPVTHESRASIAILAPPTSEPLEANAEPTPAVRPAPKVTEPTRSSRHEKKPSQQVQAHHWPSQFPTPAPLTAEQKALVQYVRETPPQVLAAPILKANFTVPHVEIKPLEIPPVEIKPLALGTSGNEIQ